MARILPVRTLFARGPGREMGADPRHHPRRALPAAPAEIPAPQTATLC